jgi:tetratricopeptide (TPR) repeat protein
MSGPKDGAAMSRFRAFCVTAGGPLATFTFLALLTWAMIVTKSASSDGSLQPQLTWTLLKIAMIQEAVMLFGVLTPARCTMYGKQVETDGLQIWKLLFHREPLPAPSQALRLLQKAVELYDRGQKQEAAELARQAAGESAPDELDLSRSVLAQLLMEVGRFEESRAIYREQLDRLDVNQPEYATVLDQFSTFALYGNARSLYAECEAELRKAIAAAPHAVHLSDTLAGLLVERGHEEEAAPLLRATQRRADQQEAIGISAAYLSVLAERKGRTRESAKYRARAIDFLSMNHPLLKRLLAAEPAAAA